MSVRYTPEELVRWTGGSWTGRPAGPLTGFHFDSRRIGPGEGFVALRTGRRDGHDFVTAARAAGAAAALVARPVPGAGLPQLVVADPLAAWQSVAREQRRRLTGPVVGISGSAGKTSTKDLLALLLGGAASGVAATEGNLNNELGVPLTLTGLDPAGTRVAVVEAGISAPGEMARLAGMIEPDVAIITLVGPAHLEELGGLEGVAFEKSRLPAALRPGGLMILPAAVARLPAFAALPGRRLIVTDAASGAAVEGAEEVAYACAATRDGTTLRLAGGGRPAADFRFRAVTPGLARNAALALAAARHLGVGDEDLRRRLAGWGPAALRAEVRRIGGRFVYLDCYNANPASMSDALEGFAAQAPADAPRLYLLGCMEELGSGSRRWHHELGLGLAGRLRPGDRVVVLGGEAAAVAAGLAAGGAGGVLATIAASLEEAAAVFAAWPGSVLVKGSRRYALEGVLASAGLEASHA